MSHTRTLSALCTVLLAYSGLAAANEIIVTYPGQLSGPCHIAVTASSGVSLDVGTGDLTTQGTFGSGCPTTQTTVPSPAFTTTVHATPSGTIGVGSPFSVSWTLANASAANGTQCTTDGSSFPSGSLAGWPTTGLICSGASCASPSFPLTAPSATGLYHFAVTCTNPGASPASVLSNADVNIGVGELSCAPAGISRLMTGKVTVNGFFSNVRTNVDLTSYAQVFGYDISDQSIHEFPGIPNGWIGLTLPKNKYISLRFTVPSTISLSGGGKWGFNGSDNPSGAGVSWSITPCEGDFGTVNAIPGGCLENLGGHEPNLRIWSINGNLGGSTCSLAPGGTYYLNYVNAALATPATSTCAASVCTFGPSNQIYVQ